MPSDVKLEGDSVLVECPSGLHVQGDASISGGLQVARVMGGSAGEGSISLHSDHVLVESPSGLHVQGGASIYGSLQVECPGEDPIIFKANTMHIVGSSGIDKEMTIRSDGWFGPWGPVRVRGIDIETQGDLALSRADRGPLGIRVPFGMRLEGTGEPYDHLKRPVIGGADPFSPRRIEDLDQLETAHPIEIEGDLLITWTEPILREEAIKRYAWRGEQPPYKNLKPADIEEWVSYTFSVRKMWRRLQAQEHQSQEQAAGTPEPEVVLDPTGEYKLKQLQEKYAGAIVVAESKIAELEGRLQIAKEAPIVRDFASLMERVKALEDRSREAPDVAISTNLEDKVKSLEKRLIEVVETPGFADITALKDRVKVLEGRP